MKTEISIWKIISYTFVYGAGLLTGFLAVKNFIHILFGVSIFFFVFLITEMLFDKLGRLEELKKRKQRNEENK